MEKNELQEKLNGLLFKALDLKIEENEKLEMVKAILRAGADVNAKDAYGNTLLKSAVHNYCPDCLELLLECGADINAKDKDGNTALMYAAISYGEPDCLKLLIKYGADVNAVNNYGWTALMWGVAILTSEEGVRLLIKHGTNVNAVDKGGDTALAIAMGQKDKNQEIIDLLINNGAGIFVKVEGGLSFVDKAVFHKVAPVFDSAGVANPSIKE